MSAEPNYELVVGCDEPSGVNLRWCPFHCTHHRQVKTYDFKCKTFVSQFSLHTHGNNQRPKQWTTASKIKSRPNMEEKNGSDPPMARTCGRCCHSPKRQEVFLLHKTLAWNKTIKFTVLFAIHAQLVIIDMKSKYSRAHAHSKITAFQLNPNFCILIFERLSNSDNVFHVSHLFKPLTVLLWVWSAGYEMKNVCE